MDEKKLGMKHVPTESNIADIGTKGLTSDRIWKLMNQVGMSMVAGMVCLVPQPLEKIKETSILDRGMQRGVEHLGACDGSSHEGDRSSAVEGRLRARGLRILFR